MSDDQSNDTAPSLEAEIDAALAAESEAPEAEDTQSDAEPDDSNAAADDEVERNTGDDDEPSFTVKVDGKTQEVTLDELLKGYQRQSDYTRKTQDLKAERDRAAAALELVEALENDPQGTLEQLTQWAGGDTDETDVDPYDQRLTQTEQFIQQQQEQAMLAQVDAEFSRLQGEYGDFDNEAVLQWALDHEQPSLEASLVLMRREQERETALDTRNKEAAKRKKGDPPVAGRSTASGSTQKPPREIKNLTDALEAALDDHGASWGDFVRT